MRFGINSPPFNKMEMELELFIADKCKNDSS